MLRGAVLALSLVTAACGNGRGDENTVTSGFAGLCAARAAAAGGQFTAAVAAFDHGPLHALAATTEKTNRRLAARLLEAKQRVEALKMDPAATAESMRRELDSLITATQDAQTETGTSPTTCRTKEPK